MSRNSTWIEVRVSKSLCWRLAIAAAIGCVAWGFSSAGSAAQRPEVIGGRRASIHWEQVPVGDGLRRIGATFDAAVFLDRRIDPSTRLSLNTRNEGLDETLTQAAAVANLGFSQIGPLSYVGPAGTAGALRTWAAIRDEDISKLPLELRRSLAAKRAVSWPRRTEPRSIVRDAVSERGWRLAGEDRIPHDLWAAGELPEMSISDQLTVLLAGFNLTFHVEEASRAITIVPLPESPPAITRVYRLRYADAQIESLRQQFPNVSMRSLQDEIAADARIEEHERLAEWLAGATPQTDSRPAAAGRQVYSLRVQEQPVRAIMAALAQRMNWTLEFDEAALQAAGLSLDRRVSFEVQEATQVELLRAILRPAGLDYKFEGNRLRMQPAENASRATKR